MNTIRTNKDVFSEENQSKLGRKADRRRGSGRPRRTGLSGAAALVTTVPNDTALPKKDTNSLPALMRNQPPKPQASRTEQSQPAVSPDTPREVATVTPPQPPTPSPSPVRRMAFYQAARSKQPQRPRSTAPNHQTPGPATPGQYPTRPLTPRPNTPQRPRPIASPTIGNNPRRTMHPGVQGTHTSNVQRFTAPAPLPTSLLRNNADPSKKVRIIPLGGLSEIGKNMTAFEYGEDIIVVDMGFLFPDSEMPGVDYIIPDVTYLAERKEKIRGVFITHGHLDHTGATPYIVERLGFPTIYGSAITIGMVKGRLEEFNLEGKNKLITVEPDKDVIQLGAFRLRPFHLVHNIPGATGLEIETPNGRVVYATDWKFDYTPAGGKPVDFRNLAAIGSRGVDLYFSDSTNADKPGHCISERLVEKSLKESVAGAKGRVIVAMFSSHLDRIQMAMNAAYENNRKVLIQGRSMQKNVEMAIELKAMNVPPHTLIAEREMNKYDDKNLLILSTGSQGEERSALIRMAKGEHRTIKLKKGDLVFLSSSPIPGNERSVSGLMELLYKAGADVMYNKLLDVHASGHAYQEELKLMAALMRPKYFFPIHGERSRRILHGNLVVETGLQPENVIIADNGSVILMDSNGVVTISDEAIPAGHVIVDGLGVGDIGTVVLRDRQAMAQEGIFVVISVFDKKKKQFITSPDIISRGFIYMRENEKFVAEVRNEIKKFLATRAASDKTIDLAAIRNDLRDNLSKLLYQKTEREPIVIPVLIEV